MLTRETKLRHYGIDEERGRWIREQAKLEKNKKLLQFAAEQSKADMADILVESLVHELGYDNLSLKCYVPINLRDFFAYKRQTMYIFWLLLTGQNWDREPVKT